MPFLPSADFSPRRRVLATAIFAACALSHLPAFGQTPHPRTWDGGGTDNNWSTAANWNGDTVLVETSSYDADLIFAGTTRLASVFDSSGFAGLSGGFNVRGLTFSAGAGAFTLSETASAGIDLLGDRSLATTSIIANNSTNLQKISLKLIVRGDLSGGVTFDAASGDISVTTAMTSSGGGLVAKTGTGTLFFSAANSYTGPTTISGGILSLSGTGRLGAASSTSTVSVLSTAIRLEINSGNAIADGALLSLAGGGTVGLADNGYLLLGTGINEIVSGLTLGGVAQNAGTYGSTASTATFKSDEYFSGTGIVTVVPEPSNLVLAVMGGLGTLGIIRRRRR